MADEVEEFDSSDDEPELATSGNKRMIDSVKVLSQENIKMPNEEVGPTEGKDYDNSSSLSLQRSIESELNVNYIPLKIIDVPSVVEGNMEITLLCGQENVQNEEKSTKIELVSRVLVGDVEGRERDVEDEFGSDRESITHQQLMDLTSKGIASLIESDPLLSDLPSDVTLEEINSQIALVQGQSISVMVAASQPAKLVVAQEGTVLDLKRSLQRHTALRLARQGRSKVKVNWRYFWRTHWLVQPGGNRLMRDSDKLKDLGIVNKSVLTYCKRLHERQR